ncbi:hypothetical protein M8J76_002265 [Diaphorina citri]|nr:hypothetical protein M8J75_008970 [Diaphorina citri]KAI5748823.1 hypothetical protein M8J76_002265 [Diaphorina citri]
MESQKDFSSNRERNNRESVIQTKPQLPSNFKENNAANVNSNQKNQDIMEPNSLESHYSEVVQKIFQNAKSPLVRDKENQAAPQTSDDQLSIGTFNRGESLAMLGTEKSIDEVRTEKIESLDETAKPPNLPSNLKKNITQSSCIVTSKSLERNLSHKQSAGSKFLASVSPEEFLKRLKKHLEISKSNLRILKKNFHDFLKEKEKLFRLNQKVSQEHPRAKEIKVSVIRADENDQGASFVQDTRTSAMTPAINPQPISQICPKDCPVNMIHIEHHHHGNSPVPCICENDNLYDANKREDSSISDFEAFPLNSFKTKLTSNAVQLKARKSNVIKMSDNTAETKSEVQSMESANQVSSPAKSDNKQDTIQSVSNNEDTKNMNDNIGDVLQDPSKILEFVKDMSQDGQKKSKIINVMPRYYQGCEKSTTHIPAACDIACIPCKTHSPECTSCVVCPQTGCTPKCLPPGSVIRTERPSNVCPPKCTQKCPPITCPTTDTTKGTNKCPKCTCGKLIDDDDLELEGDKSSAIDDDIDNRGKREFLWKSNPNIAAFKSDQKMEEGSERTDEQSDHAKLTMEDVKCTTALTCCPTTCAETCPTTCCTEPPSDGRSCPSCPSLGSHQDSKAQMQPSCLCLAEKAQQELSAQNFDHS